jgi:hypothetical protein
VKRIIDDPRQVAAFVGSKLDTVFIPPYTGLGLEIDRQMVAGVIFNIKVARDVSVTVAGEPRAFTRAFLRRIGNYVFKEMDCLRASITTEQESVVALAHRLNAQTEGRKRNHFGEGRDAIILGILRDEWKI